VLLFVHGYDFEFDEAVLWTAELKRYLEIDGPVIVYDWASRGDVLAYREDEQAVERSVPRLEGFLRELRAEMGDVRIDLIAHSIGNRLQLNALQSIAQKHSGPPLFRNMVLAAPDVASGPFVDQIAGSSKLAQRTTLYVSSSDRALLASQRLHKDLRAGRDLILVHGVDTVDVSPVDTSRTRHSYYIENRWVLSDIYQLLRDDAPPARRFGLVELKAGSASFWQLRP
jgi:esterase/lipase superfamily enzyme